MIPLGICSLAALTVVLERAVALRHSRVLPGEVIDALKAFEGSAPSVDTLSRACRRGGALARVVEGILDTRHLGRSQSMDTLNAVGRREMGQLDRGLIVLEIVAGISPLIGLLGTVLGMVTVFDAITAEGIGNAQILAAGIRKALITTIAGLSVAIPSLAMHSVFCRRVEQLAIEIQEVATALISSLEGVGGMDGGLVPKGADFAKGMAGPHI